MTSVGRAALMLLAGAAIPACSGAPEDPRPPMEPPLLRTMAQKLPGIPGLENFARMNPDLYRGAEPTEEGFRQLRAMGIRTVVDFRSHHSTRRLVEAAGMTPIEIPLRADFEAVPPKEEELQRFFDVVLDPARQPVYIHCAFGKDRTGTMAAVYRMEVEGWTAEEAIQEMEAFGYHNVYHALLHFIRTYRSGRYGRGHLHQ